MDQFEVIAWRRKYNLYSVLTGPVKADPRTLGPLLGGGVRYTGEAWEIGSR